MDNRQFFVPVPIVTEPNQPIVEICGVADALDFLKKWPDGRRGPIYQTALQCCHQANNGMMKADDARKCFAVFARITGILAKDAFTKTAIDAGVDVLPLPKR